MTEDKATITLTFNNSLPSIWVDNLSIAKRNDGVCVLNFFANMPNGNFEQTRIMTGEDNLKKFIDELCSILDYSPGHEKSE